MELKRCPHCGETKDLSMFGRKNNVPISWCYSCKNEKNKEYRRTIKGQAYKEVRRSNGEHRRNHLSRRYKITEADYLRLQSTSGGSCEICKTVPEKRLFVDHCHNSTAIRGLLCQHCNSMLGFARDSIHVLEAAIQYLKEKTVILKTTGEN